MLWWLLLFLFYAIIVVLFHVYLRYFSAQRHNFDSKYPPVVIEPWYCPFLGPILSMVNIEISMKKWCTKYGTNFTLFLLGKYYTVITKYDDLKAYYHAKEETLSMSRAAYFMLGSAYPENQYIIEHNVVSYLQSILTTQNLSYMITNIEIVIDDYFDRKNGQFWSENGDEVVIDLFEFINRLIIRMNSINLISYRFYKNHGDMLINLFTSLNVEKSIASSIVNNLKRRLRLKTKKDIAWEHWIRLLMPDIERCVKMIENNIEPTDFDVIYQNVKYSKEALEKRGLIFTPRLVAYFAYMSIVPGQLNTCTTAAYMVLEWIRHKQDEIGQLMNDELDCAPTKGNLSIEYLNSMEYIQACIYEVIRLRTDFLLSLRHAGENVPLSDDKFIPHGNLVMTPLVAAPDLYLNADKFDPGRHLKPREEMKADPYRALPFGRGKHLCIGEKYAKMQIKVLLIRLTEMCKMELLPQSTNFESTINKNQLEGLSRPTKPVLVKISKRNS